MAGPDNFSPTLSCRPTPGWDLHVRGPLDVLPATANQDMVAGRVTQGMHPENETLKLSSRRQPRAHAPRRRRPAPTPPPTAASHSREGAPHCVRSPSPHCCPAGEGLTLSTPFGSPGGLPHCRFRTPPRDKWGGESASPPSRGSMAGALRPSAAFPEGSSGRFRPINLRCYFPFFLKKRKSAGDEGRTHSKAVVRPGLLGAREG